jgi:hypothetical protein
LKVAAQPIDDGAGTGAIFQIGEQERPFSAHPLRVALHDRKVGTDVGSQVDLVNDQKIRSGNAWPAFARNLVAGGNVDDIERHIGQLGAKGSGQIIAARLDQDEIEIFKAAIEPRYRFQIDRRVFTACGMRTAAGFDADDPLRRNIVPSKESRSGR